MMRIAIGLLVSSLLLAGCHRQLEGLVIPFDHAASPHAQPAPPIEIPRFDKIGEPVAPKLPAESSPEVPDGPAAAPPHHEH